MRNALRLLLLALLFLAGQQELCASLSQTRVGNFFPLAANPRPEEPLQVPELRLDNPLLYGESVSGDTFWSKFDPEGLNETWGGDNWFANWVLPDPVAHVHASQAGSATMFDGAQDGVDRVSGGLSYVGNGMMAVLSLVPGEAAVEGGIERIAAKMAARSAEREGAEIIAEKTEQKVAQKVEQSASKTAEESSAAAEAESGGCFVAGTLVSTPNGDVPIETLHQGDIVLSYDFETQQVIAEPIESLFRNVTEYWVKIEIAGEEITATRGHRFWVSSLNNWVAAANLEAGMTVQLSSGESAKIDSVEVHHLSRDENTYNFFVADTHVYFVGRSHFLVHNGDDDKTRITYTAPEYDSSGNRIGTYSGAASGDSSMTPKQVLKDRFSGADSHPGHNLGPPELDDVHDSHAQMRGREQLLHEDNAATGESTNKRNPVGERNQRIEEYRKETEKKYGRTFKNKKC